MEHKKADPKAVARWLAERLTKDQRELPQHQAKGPIVKGPRTVVSCEKCTRMFGYTRANGAPATIGVLKRFEKRHAADHKLGRIKKIQVPS